MNWEKKYRFDISIALVILASTFLPYLHLLIDSGILSFTFFEHQFKVLNFYDLQVGVYYVLWNFSTLLLLTIWYITCDYIWRYFILIPAGFYFHWTRIDVYDCFGASQPSGFVSLIYVLLFIGLVFFARKILLKKMNKEYFVKENYLLKLAKNYFFSKSKFNNSQVILDKIDIYKSIGNTKKYLEASYYYRDSLNDKKNNFDFVNSPIELSKYWAIFICIFLTLLPFFIKISYLVPAEKMLTYGPFSIGDFGFTSISSFAYVFIWKFNTLSIVILWYATNKKWWKIIKLIPLTIFSYQFYEILFNNNSSMDEVEYVKALPVIVIILGLALILSRIFRYDIKTKIVKEHLHSEIEKTITKIVVNNLK